MAKQDGNKTREKEKADKRRKRFWDAVQLVLGGWLRNKFNYSFDKSFEPADIEGPVLVAINHACAYDPLFVGAAFKNKPLTFIASEHILRGKWGSFLDKHISFIPHQKGARGSRTALVAMKRMKKGESIFLAAEGEQTWNGRPLPVMPYTGKMVKGSGATLVTYLLEGAYLSAPRWSLSTRRGKVYGRPAGVYGPEVLKEMSDDEVEQLIAKDLDFDTWKWQKSRPEGPVIYKCKKGGNADGLERSVFTCPACGAFGSLKSQGDSIGCSCGFSVRMTDTGFLEPAEPFETVVDWEEYDRKKLAERLTEMKRAAGEDIVFTDDGVVLHRINDGHSDEEAARGKLTLSFADKKFVLSIGEYSFGMEDISNMTMVLAGRVVFSDKSGYYELLSEKNSRTNLRKYVIVRDLLLGE